MQATLVSRVQKSQRSITDEVHHLLFRVNLSKSLLGLSKKGHGNTSAIWGKGDKCEKIELLRIYQTVNAGTDIVVSSLKTTNDIISAQIFLEKLGYEPGVPDGVLGPKTKAAINGFLNKHYHPQTARVELLLNLRVASEPLLMTPRGQTEQREIKLKANYEIINRLEGSPKVMGGCRADITEDQVGKINSSINQLLRSIPRGKKKLLRITEDFEGLVTDALELKDQ